MSGSTPLAAMVTRPRSLMLSSYIVVAHGNELDMAGHDTVLLLVAGGVASELEHLSGQVLLRTAAR